MRTPIQIVDSKGLAHERGEKKIPSGQEVVYVAFWQELGLVLSLF